MASIFDQINKSSNAPAPKREEPKKDEPEISGADKTSKPMSLTAALAKMKGEDKPAIAEGVSLDEALDDEIPDFDGKATDNTVAGPNLDLSTINNMVAPGTIPSANAAGADAVGADVGSSQAIKSDPITLEVGNPPPASATPAEVTQYYLDKLAASVKHNTGGKETLKELHFQLAENPETKNLVLPDHLGLITSLMDKLTGSAHTRMTTKKVETVKKRTKKAELEAEVAGELDLGDLNISL